MPLKSTPANQQQQKKKKWASGCATWQSDVSLSFLMNYSWRRNFACDKANSQNHYNRKFDANRYQFCSFTVYMQTYKLAKKLFFVCLLFCELWVVYLSFPRADFVCVCVCGFFFGWYFVNFRLLDSFVCTHQVVHFYR